MLKNPHYHKVACALLLAAGICYGFGQYKYTIDLASPYGLFQVSVVRASGVGPPPCQSTTEINDPRVASGTPVLLVLVDVSYVAVCGRVERSLALYVVIIGSESSLGPNHCASVAMLQVKTIAAIQFVVIVITRALVFFYCGVCLLGDVYAEFQPALVCTYLAPSLARLARSQHTGG